MESFPQELIDKVIDNLPHSSLRPCSLVGRRWRRRSQEYFFAIVAFSSERKLVSWCANIPQGPDGIPSYVRTVQFEFIHSWREPALFGRVLKGFTSMTTLWIFNATIPRPRDIPNSMSFGEFGKKIERLMLLSPRCTVATVTALVLSLPNLERLFLIGTAPRKPPSVLPHASQRGPLVELDLHAPGSGVGTALAQCGVTSRKLSTSVSEAGLEQLLTLSSEVIVKLQLNDQHPSESQAHRANESPSVIPLPPLPALATLRIDLRLSSPFPRLAYILSSIHSAPALASITFASDGGWYGERFPSSGPWVDVDRWLARMALQTEVRGGVVVVMAQPSEGGPAWEGSPPEFRKVGGELKIETKATVDGD